MALDLERIIRFSVVAEERSFTRAARRLQVDQPWLSRQIRQLEEQLGFLLLQRTTRKVELTPEGEAFLGQALALADTADRTRAMARALHRQRSQQIRVGISPTSFWVQARHDVLTFFEKKNPDAQIEVISAETPRLLSDLSRRNLEVVIGPVCEGGEDFDRVLMHASSPGILVPREHPLAARSSLKMADMAGCIIATTVRSVNPNAFDKLYEPFIAAGLIPRTVVEGRVAMPYYASHERFLMLSYRGGGIEQASAPDYVRLAIEDCPVVSEMWAYRNRADNRELVRRFWSAVKHLRRAA
jgi:DNA-binding transcriptional LysR family regulator